MNKNATFLFELNGSEHFQQQGQDEHKHQEGKDAAGPPSPGPFGIIRPAGQEADDDQQNRHNPGKELDLLYCRLNKYQTHSIDSSLPNIQTHKWLDFVRIQWEISRLISYHGEQVGFRLV